MMGEVIRVSGRTPDVGEFLREAMLTQRFADVALCCPGGQRFLAHRLVLSAASPYLQEVLLAHSKTSAHCEPITVILAEVEAPELAAILGFVYTGSATVPRPRLNAFLRAADALRIRLPPVPVAMTCAQPDCKQEDFKDVKINPKYLRCDQYPSCDEWFRGGNLRDDPGNKKEIYPIESRELGTFPETVNFGYNPAGSLYSNWSTTVFQSSQDTQTQRIEQWEKSRGNYPVPITRIDEADLTEKSVEGTLIPSCYDQEISRNPLDVQRRLDPLELRLRAGNYDQTYSKLPEEQFLDRSAENGVNGAIRSREGIPQNKSMGLQYIGRTRSYEKVDAGEDLSCREVCCRWRTPRRHVANRVTASPWRQIVRPHHSPKLQPLFLQTRVEETEVGEIARVPETAPLSISTSPNRQSPKSTTTTEVLYTLEVPNNPDVTINGNSRTLEACGNSETRLREYFSPQIPFATSRAPSISTTSNETQFFQSQCNVTPPTRPALSNAENAALLTVNRKSTNHFGGQIPRTPQKPEISHPVSRLCDTIESNEKSENFSILETQKVEEETRPDEKITRRIFVNSDSNNNDAIVTTEVPQRGRTIGPEDHKCDQCGKTFVTRASLKVHSRTHSGEKPFRCADCGKQFSQLRNYKYHRSVHEGTREFAATCPECGKYFNDRGYLSSHMKIHRNRKEYGCTECGKSFNQRVAYNMHVRIHTGVKPHQCEQCGKAFSRKMLLKQHLRTHSGERPYQCQVCQKAFADRSNMTLHTRLHSGLKPYQCTLCSKAFTKKHHLKTHLNYHTGTKPYSCPNCGLRFSQSSNMRTHFKKCTVNNPGGTKNLQSPNEVHPSKASEASVISRTPTDALTPPNSDQESSILTPISKTAVIEANMT